LIPPMPTLPSTEPAMWRKVPARVHADAGVEHELFICAGSLRGVICGGLRPEG